MIHVLDKADQRLTNLILGTHNDKTEKVVGTSYISEVEWNTLCHSQSIPSIQDPFSTQLLSLLKNEPKLRIKLKPFFVAKMEKAKKKKNMTQETNELPSEQPIPQANAGQPKGLALHDAESRNKIFARLYFLDLFFSSPYGCAKTMVTTLTGESTINDSSITTSVNKCMEKVLSRGYVDRLPAITLNSQLGTGRNPLYMVELIVGFNIGYSSIEDTKRFLNKLPVCQGDLSPTLGKGIYSDLRRKRYSPFVEETVSTNDGDFITQILLVPTKKLQDTFVNLLIAGFVQQDTHRGQKRTAAQRRVMHLNKVYNFHLNRQINMSWIKIVNMVGSQVHPTDSTNEGKQNLKYFWGLPPKIYFYQRR